MARSVVNLQSVSQKIRVEILGVGEDAVDEVEEGDEDDSGMQGEKIMVKRDDEVIKKLMDLNYLLLKKWITTM